MADRIHQRLIGHDEKYRGLFRGVFMPMKIPQRDDEGVSLFPFIPFVADVAYATAAPDVINGRAGMPMASGLFAGTQHMNLAGHRRQGAERYAETAAPPPPLGDEASAVVPEPATLAIWGLGALGCAVAAYRRRR